MIVYLAADHAGYEMKERMKTYLKGLGYQVRDEGAFSLDENDDYPDFVRIVAKQVASDPDSSRGIIFGGSGQGEAIVANRYANVRACVYYGGSESVLTVSRAHNNSNVLSLGARFLTIEQALEAARLWLTTDYSGEERHARRIAKIDSNIRQIESF